MHRYRLLSILTGMICPTVAWSASDCDAALSVKPGVVIGLDIQSKVKLIARDFCEIQKSNRRQPVAISVTDGVRTPTKEAEELTKRLAHGNSLDYYENQEAITEVKEAYRKGQSIESFIVDQISRGCFVSKHVFGRAIDVSRSGFDESAAKTFRTVAISNGALVIENEGGRKDHFHLNFPPYPGNPKKCPRRQ